MKQAAKNEILRKSDELLNYLDKLHLAPSQNFSEEEVSAIIAKEEAQTQKNYERAIAKFQETNHCLTSPQIKRFVVYWGYPGAGKSYMSKKLIERFGQEEDCLPFNIIDKDQHRDLFPNLFNHLKNGHLDECEKFAGVTIDYVRQILDLSLQSGERSILSIGSMGAGSEFKDIAYLSSVYRSASLYDQIIFQNKELYPRLVSNEYFSRVVDMLPNMIERIDTFQQENSENVDLMVLNRSNEVLYDSRRPHTLNVKEVIAEEESRPLNDKEIVNINKQLTQIRESIAYRHENQVYAPYANELEMAKTAIQRIHKLVSSQPIQSNTHGQFKFGILGKASGFDR